METGDQRIEQAVRATQVLRPPKQSLSTFGTTNLYYYLLTEPAYETPGQASETVIREGRVLAERPRIVTPFYLSRLEGFSTDARRYFEGLMQVFGPATPGLLYGYKNEPGGLNIVSEHLPAVVEKLNADIDRRGDPLACIIRGQDELWDVSLLKFIYEITRSSVPDNVSQFGSRGLLSVDRQGIPAEARLRIDELFARVGRGEAEPRDLKAELDRWDAFEEYQDRFLRLFRKGR